MQWEMTLQQNKPLLGVLWPGIGLRNAKAQALHTQPSQWNPEIRFHKQCTNMIWTFNTSTATWQEHEVHGFAALLPYPGFICLKQKRNWVITVCWGWRAFSWEQMTADDSYVWAFLLDPGPSYSLGCTLTHTPEEYWSSVPFKNARFRVFLGYFTDG